jgi:hypothetical protein
MPLLLSKRTVRLPTLWGWCVLLAVLAALVAGTGLALAWSAYGWLAASHPQPVRQGAPAERLLIVEGWLGAYDLDQAVTAFRSGRYTRVVTTGGPIEDPDACAAWPDFATRAAAYLKAHGLAGAAVDAVVAPATDAERTWQSAVALRDWAARGGMHIAAADLFSAGVHARRSQRVFQLAFEPAVPVGVIAARPSDYDAAHWWRSSAGAKAVMSEVVSLAWTACCFWPVRPAAAASPHDR